MDTRRNLRWKVVLLSGLLGLGSVLQPAAAQVKSSSAPAWSAQDEVFYHIFVRSFRDSNGDRIGDLQGIQEQLDYLQNLGVTSILLTPINPSPFYHNYFASDFEGVDPAYGDMRSAQKLIEAVHARGMKLYLDQEIQYAAGNHPWFEQSRGQPASEFSRYIIYNGPGNTLPESAVFGITTAPTYSGAKIDLATLNLLDPAVQQYFQKFFMSWVDPNGDGRFDDGVDGFRIDHMMDDLDAKGILKNLFADFWAPIFAQVRAVNPRVKIIAEQADWSVGDDFLTRGGADLVFAFPIRMAVTSFDRDSIVAALALTLEKTPSGKGQLVFIENHDMHRFASVVDGDLKKQKIGAALNVLLKGTPLIYYGQEIGMKGKQSQAWGTDANDIPVREAFELTSKIEDAGSAIWYKDTGVWWPDRYSRDDDGISVAEQKDDPNSLLSFYRQLLTLRRTRPELILGDQRVIATNQKDVLAITRSTATEASLLIVNLSDQPATVVVDKSELPTTFASGQLEDLISNTTEASAGDVLRVDLAPFGIKLVARR